MKKRKKKLNYFQAHPNKKPMRISIPRKWRRVMICLDNLAVASARVSSSNGELIGALKALCETALKIVDKL